MCEGKLLGRLAHVLLPLLLPFDLAILLLLLCWCKFTFRPSPSSRSSSLLLLLSALFSVGASTFELDVAEI